ncbi:MAG TPA: hypothetical protein VKE41_22045 [Roseiflexaceae bacterium]|nr:hypothetical protein [Roseiflexaceae bacterium]
MHTMLYHLVGTGESRQPAYTPQGRENIMHRNGKTPQAAATTTQAPETITQAPATILQLSELTEQAPDMAVQAPAAAMQPSGTAVQASASAMQAPASSTQAAAGKSRPRPGGYAADASIEARLLAAKLAIEGVLGDANLLAIMAARGYSAARLAEGLALREQALALHQQQRTSLGAQLAATDARTASQAQAHSAYMGHVAVARVALRDDRGAACALDLAAARKRTRAGWLAQAQQFYANLLAAQTLVASLEAYGVTREQLRETQQAVVAVETALVAQQTTKDAAQQATQARDAAMQALNRWMRDFVAIARVALASQPQLLEKLGVGVASLSG